ncbi:alpha/beta fold hydrolase [Roseibium sediminicola]|uniref:Alpha/beta fold hydrolase n=1 Tax=Roseibium sediminicola TaxID=2933272 RepID=A0ABT0GZS4_9HYPH|nr:alpha/beta fold hydrolase [Roseibium sp. CAU 1639]MCK7614932.1 alpha/beta fold hydrolase [Roseibium sp. CAU 1639]
MFDHSPAYPFNSRFVTINGYKIHVVELGPENAQPILFVHGSPTNSYVWRDIMPKVQRDTGARCIALDLLGFGKSDKPMDLRYTLDIHAEIIAGLVDQLGLKDITLVAEDWGGPLGMLNAVRRPELFARAVLFESFLWDFTYADDFEPKFRLPFKMMRGPAGYFVVQVLNLMIKKLIPEHCPIPDEGMRYYKECLPTIRSRRSVLALVKLNPLEGRPKASMEIIREIQRGMKTHPMPIDWLLPSPGVIVSEDYPPSQQKFARFCQMFPQIQAHDFGPGHHFLSEENPMRVAEMVSQIVRSN